MTALDPKIREGFERIRKTSAAEHALLPFPDCPDDRRAAPNDMIRSALFGVVKRGPRIVLHKQELPAPPGWKLYYTGQRLDQIDFDIWLEIMYRCRNTVPGTEVRFTLRSVLSALGHGDSSSAYKFLEKRLHGMAEGAFFFESENNRFACTTGNLFTAFSIDRETKEAVVETNKRLRMLYNNATFLNFSDRLSLSSQLSKWIHALIASHVEWMPTKVETLMKKSGSSCERLRKFRENLRFSLSDLQDRKLIRSWTIDSRDLVHIHKDLTPSQKRYVGR